MIISLVIYRKENDMTIDAKSTESELDVKTATYWLCEAWGDDVDENQVLVKDGWLFIRNWDEDDECWEQEVDCVRSPRISNDIYGEIYDYVDYSDSPFIPDNDDKVSASIRKLTKSYNDSD